VHLLIPHQANRKIITQVAKRLKIEMDDVFVNIEKYGNTSSASIPIALDESLRSGRIQDKNTVVLAAFGAGLTWGAVVLKWSKFVPRRRFISMPRSTDT
nr:ketoacyl-ACP synthase III [FCB group bacterium]